MPLPTIEEYADQWPKPPVRHIIRVFSSKLGTTKCGQTFRPRPVKRSVWKRGGALMPPCLMCAAAR